MVPPEGNDWGSINTLEDYQDLVMDISAGTVTYSLDDDFDFGVGFSASATVGGTLELQLFADGYDSIDAAAPLESGGGGVPGLGGELRGVVLCVR